MSTLTTAVTDEVLRLYFEEGLSQSQVGLKVGRSQTWVRQAIVRSGRRYRSNATPSTAHSVVNPLILEHYDAIVRALKYRVRKKHPYDKREDVLAEMIGCIPMAAAKYDPTRGSFVPFMIHKVMFEWNDQDRANHHDTRTTRKLRSLVAATQDRVIKQTGRCGTPDLDARLGPQVMRSYHENRAAVPIDSPMCGRGTYSKVDVSRGPQVTLAETISSRDAAAAAVEAADMINTLRSHLTQSKDRRDVGTLAYLDEYLSPMINSPGARMPKSVVNNLAARLNCSTFWFYTVPPKRLRRLATILCEGRRLPSTPLEQRYIDEN